jgi:uncharacterized protein
MSRPDFAAATSYAFERLSRELSSALRFHSLAHTRDDVLPAVDRLAAAEHVAGESLMLVRTAACFHDIGYVLRRDEHEEASVYIARAVLPGFGYAPAQIDQIAGMIMSTKLPQSPHSLLEQLVADADLDSLGRDDFWERNTALREELQAFDVVSSDEEWYRSQLDFLQTHHYWTPTARALRDEVKARNVALMAGRLSIAAQSLPLQ